MNHYLKSLFISIFLYLSLFALALYALEKSEEFSKEESKSLQKSSRVSINMIEQKTAPLQKKPQPVNKPKPTQQPKKKIVKKKAQIKKEVLVKKAVKATPIKKVKPQEAVEEVVQEINQEIIESEQEIAQAEQTMTQEVMNKTQTQTQESAQDLKAKQDLFLAYLVERINSHKIYPKSARRRAIQGDVKMAFNVFANGNVENIRLVSGKKIFKTSAYNAIDKSFPIDIDTTLFHFPKEFTITIAYILK